MPLTPELEDYFGPRIDTAVDKVSGLLPLEWSLDMRSLVRNLVADAYAAGASQSRLADAEARRSF